MLPLGNKRIAIPYGTLSVRPELLTQVQKGQSDDLERPGAPVAVIEPALRQTLRMYSLQHPFALPPQAQELAHAYSQLAFLTQHLAKLCGNWAKPQVQFIDRYVQELRMLVSDNASHLNKKTQGLDGLVEMEHWCFAAPMPLPRAHLFVSSFDANKPIHPHDFVLMDFAFWNGTKIIGVQISNGSTLIGSRKKALKRLVDFGVCIRFVNSTSLQDSKNLTLLQTLGDEFLNFWNDINFPHSPFRGRGIEAPRKFARS